MPRRINRRLVFSPRRREASYALRAGFNLYPDLVPKDSVGHLLQGPDCSSVSVRLTHACDTVETKPSAETGCCANGGQVAQNYSYARKNACSMGLR
jgi:hypothetical protein